MRSRWHQRTAQAKSGVVLAGWLPDSGFLQEEDARRANAHGYTRHRPALPLYTQAEAEACLGQRVPHPYGESVSIAGSVRATFTRAGHIVGSACVALDTGTGIIGFTGDVGGLWIHGAAVPVQCDVAQVPGLSAHADYREMLAWLGSGGLSPSGSAPRGRYRDATTIQTASARTPTEPTASIAVRQRRRGSARTRHGAATWRCPPLIT